MYEQIKQFMRKPNYDKFPSTVIAGTIFQGWDEIRGVLSDCLKSNNVLAVDCYTGVYEEELVRELSKLSARLVLVRDLYKEESELRCMTERFMTEDVLFGYVTNLCISDYFDAEKLEDARRCACGVSTPLIIIGTGAGMVAPGATLVYVDMARWEIQQRCRRHEVKALGIDNREDAVSLQYKRGYFNDWRICDRYKSTLFEHVDYWLDSHIPGSPKMIDRQTFYKGIDKTASKPFRVVPYFDQAPWGGQWMKEVCDLDPDVPNYGWCFDCVPEENSLYLEVNGVRFELPSVDLVLLKSKEGFRWSAINGTRSSNDLKFCFKAKSVNDVQGMSLCCVSDVITPQYVTAICNSNFISRYTEAFINSTVIFQINDCRQIPIIIPNKDEIIKFSTLFEKAKRYVKSQTPDMSYLNNLQLELDDLVLQLYRL